MQLEQPLAKDIQLWMGEPSFYRGNVGRVPEEMRNGEEKAAARISIVKVPIPPQRWICVRRIILAKAFEPAPPRICLLSATLAPGIGLARFVGKLLKALRLL